MAKRKRVLTEKKIDQFEKEGRGQGEKENYKPWFNIQDVSSHGLSTRVMGWKTNRIHHFLSKNETNFFYECEWNLHVKDIREQFPLHRIDTLEIAKEKGIKHPVDPHSKTPIVMTTDFLLTLEIDGQKKLVARTVKPSSDLENGRTLEKFEIEREYWERQGIDWGIYTELETQKDFVNNVEWLHGAYYLHNDFQQSVYEALLYQLKLSLQNYGKPIIKVLVDFENKFNLENGLGVELFKHLICRKKVEVNISKRIQLHFNVEDIILSVD
ncbi:TnsA endonuclease N-terminal domain-containing protein [Gottfriedia acidiceleris]|uniref:TnsA endonuclease N-terminal domain-containing protein n=1 Tax=Gottfriedia acidiceleris TaxID=371036 RepID=UPI000B4498CF|nr:TnsA endonuclease N-terminal domain-containing protein [Gottfriedia acidiceleris]